MDNEDKGLIYFENFFRFVFLLFKGDLLSKIKFIFKLIAGKTSISFSFVNLKTFYTRVNNTSSNEYRQVAETETALTVFKLIGVSEFSQISYNKFKDFLLNAPDLLDLFDVIEINVEKGKQLKLQTHLGITILNRLSIYLYKQPQL